jgi:hypothetical protein
MNDKWYNSDFATSLGMGLLIFFISIGMGTCMMLSKSEIKPNTKMEERK